MRTLQTWARGEAQNHDVAHSRAEGVHKGPHGDTGEACSYVRQMNELQVGTVQMRFRAVQYHQRKKRATNFQGTGDQPIMSIPVMDAMAAPLASVRVRLMSCRMTAVQHKCSSQIGRHWGSWTLGHH